VESSSPQASATSGAQREKIKFTIKRRGGMNPKVPLSSKEHLKAAKNFQDRFRFDEAGEKPFDHTKAK